MFAVKVICLLACAAIAHSDGLDRIVGGYDARQGQFPFVASVRTPQNQHLCGGVIISRRHILTAGHCVQRTMENPNLVAYAGAHTRTDGTPYKLSHAIRHPGFHPQVAINDISLLITANQIVFNQLVAAVPALPPTDLNDAVSYTGFVAGLGFVRVCKEGRLAQRALVFSFTRLIIKKISGSKCEWKWPSKSYAMERNTNYITPTMSPTNWLTAGVMGS